MPQVSASCSSAPPRSLRPAIANAFACARSERGPQCLRRFGLGGQQHPQPLQFAFEYAGIVGAHAQHQLRSEEHTSELQSLMRISYAVFCLKKKKNNKSTHNEKRDDIINI